MNKIIIFLISIIIFTSCNEDKYRSVPQSTGTPGHILVITSSSNWNGEIGKGLQNILKNEFSGLPQSEPLFNVSTVSEEAFSNLLHRTRNILITDISINNKEPKISVAYNSWANPQIVMTIRAKDKQEFLSIIKNNSAKIVSYFEKAERDRLIKTYTELKDEKIILSIQKSKNIYLTVPKGFKKDVDSSGYMWISRETPRLSQAFLIWSYQYKDTSQLNREKLLNAQDSLTQKFVPGPKKGTFMIAERRFPIVSKEFELNGNIAVEMRGLWHVDSKDVFMGGPFLSITTIDKKRNRIVTVYSYIYAGKQDKRNFVRQMEAVLYTLKIL
jgi:hypothetical protein